MERPRETWTDERLDDFSRRVETLSEDVRALATRIDAQGFELSRRLDAQGAELSGRIDALQRTMIQIGATTGAGIFATLVSVIATRS